MRAALVGIDVVVNAAGAFADAPDAPLEQVHTTGPERLFEGAVRCGVERIVQISALGADAGAATRFHRTKREGDERLAALGARHPSVEWCVVRPSLVYGPGGRSTALLTALAALPLAARAATGRSWLQPIQVDDLAEAVANLVGRPDPLPRFVDAVGPEAVTLDDVLARLRAWLGRPPAHRLPIADRLFDLLAIAGDGVGGGPISTEGLSMLRRGSTGDVDAFVRDTGVQPSSLVEGLARHPATEADRRAAASRFLRGPLRVALAATWIAGGLVPLLALPIADSMALLARLDLSGAAAWAVLLAAAAWDVALGTAILARFRPPLTAAAQVGSIFVYSAILSVAMPEAWLDPFGALVKNLPFAVGAVVLAAMET